jgi:NAD-reducing hydrogenase large subunit
VSVTRTLRLDQWVDSVGARIVVQLNADAGVAEAWFVLDGLPRVEGLLRGRPIASVPTLVEHLCGICPVAHHLAGVRAFDSLTGFGAITPTAQAVRRLVHHGEVLQTHARQLADVNAERALNLRSFARQVLTAAAGPGHFPVCAVPGGVMSAVSVARRNALRDGLDRAMDDATSLAGEIEGWTSSPRLGAFPGCDVALVDRDAALDLYGDQLRAVSGNGSMVIDTAEPDEWPDLMTETRPGTAASRPYLRVLGPERGRYRVGPVAQLRVGTHLSTARAERARQRWAAAGGGARWARAIVALHAVEVIQTLTDSPDLVGGPLVDPTAAELGVSGSPTVATGWVDGARGLLVHTYQIGQHGELIDTRITTPTAQNEGWLAGLLMAATDEHAIHSLRGSTRLPRDLLAAMEAAVREADPCLPCTSAPLHTMELAVTMLDAEGGVVANWQPRHGGAEHDTEATAGGIDSCA